MGVENENKPVPRKKFVLWAVGVVSTIAATKYFFYSGRRNKKTTVKVLTQDGKLVEVEVSKLPRKKRKIEDAEIFTWVKRKSSL